MPPPPPRNRRRRPPDEQPPERSPRFTLSARELLAGAALIVAVGAVIVAVVILLRDGGGGTDGDGGVAVPGAVRGAIERLARDSIEVLPRGEWPSLYDSFTTEYQQRCPREDFARAGEESAAALGADLPFLQFVRLENLAVAGDSNSARGTIVGEVVGRSEYKVLAAFQKQDGEWKIAPAPETQGCDAFSRLES